jgi:hypothetical protein
LLDVARGGAGYLRQHSHATGNHVAVVEVSDAHHAVDAFADEIDQPIALAHVDLDPGIFRQEIRQARQHEMTCERAVDIDAQQPLGLGAAERRLGILQIGDQRETSPVIGLAHRSCYDPPLGRPPQARRGNSRQGTCRCIGAHKSRREIAARLPLCDKSSV